MYHINFIKLKILNLYRNHLFQVNTGLLYFPKISDIDLGSNLLLHIDLHFINWGQGPSTINLLENTWNCSGNWDWLADGCLRNETGQYTWKSSRNSSKLILYGLDKLACQYPEERWGERSISHEILKSYIESPCFGDVSFGRVERLFHSSVIIIILSLQIFKNIIWNTFVNVAESDVQN